MLFHLTLALFSSTEYTTFAKYMMYVKPMADDKLSHTT
jgi:hypothetical protein